MKLRYLLLVTGPAYGTQQASCAFQFAQALLKKGHSLESVFFYREGVHNANQLISPASDECNLLQQWQALAKEYDVPLNVCIAASLRRGIVEQSEAKKLGLPQYNLAEGFTFSGLGALGEAMLLSDRVMQF